MFSSQQSGLVCRLVAVFVGVLKRHRSYSATTEHGRDEDEIYRRDSRNPSTYVVEFI